MNDLEEFGEAGDSGEEPRANLIAWGSVVVGGLVLVGQPIGCVFPVLGTGILTLATAVGLGLAFAGYRQAMTHRFAGLDGALIGFSFAAVNILFALMWMLVSVFFVLIGVIILLAQ